MVVGLKVAKCGECERSVCFKESSCGMWECLGAGKARQER